MPDLYALQCVTLFANGPVPHGTPGRIRAYSDFHIRLRTKIGKRDWHNSTHNIGAVHSIQPVSVHIDNTASLHEQYRLALFDSLDKAQAEADRLNALGAASRRAEQQQQAQRSGNQ